MVVGPYEGAIDPRDELIAFKRTSDALEDDAEEDDELPSLLSSAEDSFRLAFAPRALRLGRAETWSCLPAGLPATFFDDDDDDAADADALDSSFSSLTDAFLSSFFSSFSSSFSPPPPAPLPALG